MIDEAAELLKLKQQIEGKKEKVNINYDQYTVASPSNHSSYGTSSPFSGYKKLRVKKGIKLDMGLGYKEDQIYNLLGWSPFLIMNDVGHQIDDADPNDFELVD